jgi:hypothetical protein
MYVLMMINDKAGSTEAGAPSTMDNEAFSTFFNASKRAKPQPIGEFPTGQFWAHPAQTE